MSVGLEVLVVPCPQEEPGAAVRRWAVRRGAEESEMSWVYRNLASPVLGLRVLSCVRRACPGRCHRLRHSGSGGC